MTALETAEVAAPRKVAQCTLVSINLDNPAEYQHLLQQRIVCGWHKDAASLDLWRSQIAAKTKAMFWIVPRPPSAQEPLRPDSIINSESAPIPPSTGGPDGVDLGQCVGHISLESEADDPSLAQPDKSILMLSTFFISPPHRSSGLGRAAVQVAEAAARVEPYGSPLCRAITATTITRRYTEDDEWRKIWPRLGRQAPERGRSTEDWYRRMGYVRWKEEPRYPERTVDGEDIMLVAVFLRKELG